MRREAESREELLTIKQQERNDRKRENLIVKLAEKREDFMRIQKYKEQFERLLRELDVSNNNNNALYGDAAHIDMESLDPAIIEIADLERQIDILGKPAEPIKVTEVDVYRQYQGNNFKSVDLPAFKRQQEEGKGPEDQKAVAPKDKLKQHVLQVKQKTQIKMSLKERIELSKQFSTIEDKTNSQPN